MQSQRWQERQITCRQLVHLLFLSAAIFFLIGLGTVLVLSAMGRISGALTAPLSASFVVLSALFGFLQWYVPRSSTMSTSPVIDEPPTEEPFMTKTAAISLDPTLSKEDRAFIILLERLRAKLTKKSGTLLIRAQRAHANTLLTISADRWLRYHGRWSTQKEETHVRQYTIEGYPIYVAIYENISPGSCHIAYGSSSEKTLADTSIIAGEVTEIDARKLLPDAL